MLLCWQLAYTLKMSYKMDYSDKSTFNWISVLRLPDFVKKEDFDWAVAAATETACFLLARFPQPQKRKG